MTLRARPSAAGLAAGLIAILSCVPPPFTRTATLPGDELEQTSAALVGNWTCSHNSPPLGHRLLLADTGVFIYELKPSTSKSSAAGMATGRWEVDDYGVLKLTMGSMKGSKYGDYSGVVVGKLGEDSPTRELFRDGVGSFSFFVTRSRLQVRYDGARYTYRRQPSDRELP